MCPIDLNLVYVEVAKFVQLESFSICFGISLDI